MDEEEERKEDKVNQEEECGIIGMSIARRRKQTKNRRRMKGTEGEIEDEKRR